MGQAKTLHILLGTISPGLLQASPLSRSLDLQHHTSLDSLSTVFTFNKKKG